MLFSLPGILQIFFSRNRLENYRHLFYRSYLMAGGGCWFVSFSMYQNFTRPAVDSFVSYGLLTLQSVEYLTELLFNIYRVFRLCGSFTSCYFFFFLLSRLISAVRRLSCIIIVFLCWTPTHRIPCTDTCRVRALTHAWYGIFFKPVAYVEWWHSRWNKKGLNRVENVYVLCFIDRNGGMLSKHSARNSQSVGTGITCSASIFSTTLAIHSFQFH